MSDPLLDLIGRGIQVFDLGRPLFVGMPQSHNHPQFMHTLPRRHGDMVRADGGSAANDLIVMGTHVGTHLDALAHVSQLGKLYGGVDAAKAAHGGRFMEHGVHTVEPMVRRGVLLDVPAALGTDACDAAYEITPADLDGTVAHQNITVAPHDVVLIRSGWGRRFEESAESYAGTNTGVPGVGEAGAQWLARHQVHAAGADTTAFERLAPGRSHSVLPAHRVLLVEAGIYLIESLALEQLAAAQIHEFTLIVVPMNIIGATGSPVRPLAVVADG